MSRTSPDLNTVQLTIFVGDDDNYSSSLYWSFDDDTFDDETIDYMKTLGTGLLFLLQTRPEYISELGTAFLEGQALGSEDVVFDPDFEFPEETEEPELKTRTKDGNVITFKPTKTKH